MRLWPPILWIPVYIASELILLGSHHRWGLLASGGALALFAFLTSLWLTLRRGDSPRPRWFQWALDGVALCYVQPAVAASRLGVQWAAGALGAAVIPMTAVSLTLAIIRSKTRVSDDGHYRDMSGDTSDPGAGIGVDDETPLGDTDQHSDVIEARQAGRACGSPRLGAGPCLPAAGTYGKTMRLDRFLRTIDETAGIPREYAPLFSVVT